MMLLAIDDSDTTPALRTSAEDLSPPTHRDAMKDLQLSGRNQTHDRNEVSPALDQTFTPRQPTPRARHRTRQADKQVARFRGEDALADNEEDEDPEISEHYTRLKARIRHTLESMLGISNAQWSEVGVLFPTLSEEEIQSYLVGDLTVDDENFRIDFERSWTSLEFNRQARRVFIDRYLAKVRGGAYLKNPTPAGLLQPETIGKVLDKHMAYCRQRWRRSKNPPTEEQAVIAAKRVSRNSRRRTVSNSLETYLILFLINISDHLHFSRLVVIRRHGYDRHLQLLMMLEPVNMSGDETDGPVKKHPPTFRIVIARWQSPQLRNFLWSLDTIYREDWANPVHRRASVGNPPRLRVLRDNGHDEDGVAPAGLWRNCYDERWLQGLRVNARTELEVMDEDYDFTLAAQ